MRIVATINGRRPWVRTNWTFEEEFPQAKYVRLSFDEPVTVATRYKLPKEELEGNGEPVNEEGYWLLTLPSFVKIVFRGVELDGSRWSRVLVASELSQGSRFPGPHGEPSWDYALSFTDTERGLSKLERIIDDLR